MIRVQSPQFEDANWLYIATDAPGRVVAEQMVEDYLLSTKTRNVFVETALTYALTYLKRVKRWGREKGRWEVTILADDDYYSRPGKGEGVDRRGKFTKFGCKLSEAHKTGLGSSAALTTALVAALVMQCGGETDEMPMKQIHNLAQAAHCAAQGKVGSGFDVAAAVFGSCLYRRFTPKVLEDVGDASQEEFGEKLHRCVEDLDADQKWDVEIASHAVKVPDRLLLVMCDVDCGSETPGMVKKILQWRKDKPEEANMLWVAIQRGTEDLCSELRRLSEGQGLVSDSYQDLADIILTIRSLVREMSDRSKVPVEPSAITELLDFCTALPGVIGGVAPGAGGYDAVALLIKDDGKSLQDLQEKLQGWRTKEKSGAVIGDVRLLGVKQEKEGVKMEDISSYEGWT